MTIVLLPTLPDEKNGIFKRSYVNSNNMSILTQAFCILGPFVLASGWHTGIWCQFCSTSWVSTVQFSRSVMSNSLWPHILQHASPSCPSPTPGAYSNSCPSSWWCHPTISSSVAPSPSAFNLYQHQGLFQGISSSHQVAKVLKFQLQHQSSQWIFRTDFL